MRRRWSLACARCDLVSPDAATAACPKCGGPFLVRYVTGRPAALDEMARGVWRYRAWLPLDPAERAVSLGEGGTPLVRLGRWAAACGLDAVYAKLEYAGPTGSFKDRGASVLVSRAAASGAHTIVEDSSGNAGAAIAAYAARAGLICRIAVPSSAPPAKLRQMRAYGAALRLIEGPREAAAEAARQEGAEPGAAYAGHNVNPFFVEGCKTFAFEIAEDLELQVPDHVIVPVGGGSLLAGAGLGFAQWRAAGVIDREPRLHAVQATACMPLVAAYAEGQDEPAAVVRRPTVAGGIEIEAPARGRLLLGMIRSSAGSAVAVEEDEILDAQREVARLEGIFMEPTSAAAFAGLRRLARLGSVRASERVVVAVTGGGLKDPEIVDRW